MSDDNHLLFETYKLHTELAERAASLRESLNQPYAGMVASIVAASALLYRFAPNSEAVWLLPILGMLISFSWILSLSSVTARLSAKHKVLVILEAQLPFNFLEREENEFDSSYRLRRRKYTSLLMPVAFLFVCVAWMLFLFAQCK